VFRRRIAKQRAHVPRLLDRAGHGLVHAGRGLQHRRHQLLADPFVGRDRGDLVEARHELVALGRDELELLLDADRKGLPGAERVLHAATLAAPL
jgi:hypothetical protein